MFTGFCVLVVSYVTLIIACNVLALQKLDLIDS